MITLNRKYKSILLAILLSITFNNYATNIDSLKILLDTTSIDSIKEDAYKIIIPYFFNKGDHNECIKYSKYYLSDFKNDSSYVKGIIFQVIANSYNNIGLYSMAYDNINKSIIIHSNNKDTIRLIDVYITLSNIYSNLGNYDEAFKSINKSLNLLKTIKEDKASFYKNIFSTLGNLYLNTEQIDSAKKYFYKTREYLPKDNRNSFVINNINLSRVYYKEKDYKNSLYYLEQAVADSNETKEYVKNIIFTDFAKIYLKQNKINLAKQYAFRALNFAKKENEHSLTLTSYSILKDISIKEKNCKNTEIYVDKLMTLNDSLKLNELKIATNFFEKILINEQKEKEIITLKKDNKIKELKIKQKNNRIIAVSVFLLLSLLISVVLLLQRNKLNKAYKKIVSDSEKNIILMKKYKSIAKELKSSSDLIKDEIEENKVIKETKYKSSSLTKEAKDAILKKIYFLLEEKEIFKNQSLKLDDVAEMVGVNKTYISQALTEENKPFIDLINKYRIDNAKILLSDNKNNNLTIEAIAEDSGFKYTSTFNRAFKKHIGVTPSIYLKNLNKI